MLFFAILEEKITYREFFKKIDETEKALLSLGVKENEYRHGYGGLIVLKLFICFIAPK